MGTPGEGLKGNMRPVGLAPGLGDLPRVGAAPSLPWDNDSPNGHISRSHKLLSQEGCLTGHVHPRLVQARHDGGQDTPCAQEVCIPGLEGGVP